jgi:hypothetical protein
MKNCAGQKPDRCKKVSRDTAKALHVQLQAHARTAKALQVLQKHCTYSSGSRTYRKSIESTAKALHVQLQAHARTAKALKALQKHCKYSCRLTHVQQKH